MTRHMRIEEVYASTADAVPRALMLLEGLAEAPTYHQAHNSRPPLAAYRISFGAAVQRLLAVVTALSDVQAAGQVPGEDPSRDQQLLDVTDHMLDSLMQHVDDCGSVLRGFFAPDDVRYARAYRRFKESVVPYRDHIGRIDNYLKHNQGRLVLISFSWRDTSCFGYFVEGPIEAGSGPAEEVHGQGGTAFSFNRDIPFHLCHLFAISDRLAATIEQADLAVDAVVSRVHGQDSIDLARLVTLSAGLPRVFFPDEVRKPVPLVRADGAGVLVEFPSSRGKPSQPPTGAHITTVFSGDGVTKAYKLPYLGRGVD